MAAQILRAAVDDDIDAEIQRALVERCSKGVVDDGHDSILTAEPCHAPDVDDAQKRIGRRLYDDDFCLGAYRLGHGLGTGIRERIEQTNLLPVIRSREAEVFSQCFWPEAAYPL